MAKATEPPLAIKDALTPAFGRSQAEWALWYQAPENAKRKPSPGFKMRVKHLLEFDRSEPVRSPAKSLAFSDEPPGGRGDHTLFSVFDVMLLEAALGFLSCGFKRKEVVLHVRARRLALARGWAPLLNQRLKVALAQLKQPTATLEDADMKRLMLHAASLEDTEPAALARLNELPAFTTADEILDAFDNHRARLIVLDLSYSAHHLPTFLLKAPLRRRGPS